MKRRKFLQKSALATTALTAGFSSTLANSLNQPPEKELYELRVYTLNSSQGPLDSYLSKALIPALNRFGVKKVGVFNEQDKSEPTKIYLLIPYPSFGGYGRIIASIQNDKEFEQASAEYDKISLENAVYNRYESSLLLAFDGLPQLMLPPPGPRIFEIRTYEGYSEDALKRKIRMFNEHEFAIFNRVKLNSVFFGECIAGTNLPSLTYMVWFKSMEERDRNWKAFGQDPDWQKISKDPQFADSVSRIHKIFLEPLSYSQV